MNLALGVSLLALSIGCATPSVAQHAIEHEGVPLTRLRDGPGSFSAYSGLTDSVRAVVRDSLAWRELWGKINQPFYPRPPLPSIDFQRDMIVVAALGSEPSLGYDIVIESANADSSGIEIAVRRTSPARDCPVAAAVSQPVDLARIPASDRPVRFRERSVTTTCTGGGGEPR